MQETILSLLRCPVSKSILQLQVISKKIKKFDYSSIEIIDEGILFAEKDWFYPIINGIPRLIVEAFIDYDFFFKKNLADYEERKNLLEKKYADLINSVIKKNKKTKESFSLEWSIYNYDADKTWNADATLMLDRFLKETSETAESLKTKTVFDVGCGNGYLSQLIAKHSAFVVAMDFSKSIERAYEKNSQKNILFIQGDVQFPPITELYFDIVQCSGVLIHTKDPKSSFRRISPFAKTGGKLSVWLYHSRKNLIHNFFNRLRKYTSKLPLRFQYYFLMSTIFPISYVVKKIKGNKQNKREMIIEILDWFTPEFRHERTHEEVISWFLQMNYVDVKITTDELFGFNVVGVKNVDHTNP